MWKCQECGRRFRTAKAAERASNNGCPGCGGVDIDLADEPEVKQVETKPEQRWPSPKGPIHPSCY